MRCLEASPMIVAYADGEVDGLRALRLRRHIAGCPDCAALDGSARDLRTRIRNEVPRYQAPADFVAQLAAEWGDGSVPATRVAVKPSRWRWMATGALAGCVATVLVSAATLFAIDWRDAQDTRREAVALHVRATLGNTLVQVASSDRHTVKPWISSHLDYSPPVVDLAAQGFPLIGARLDVLDGRRVAVLVYHSNEHSIDVFVWPGEEGPASGMNGTIRGFNVLRASGHGMQWLAVSDVNTAALTTLVETLAGR